MQLVFLLYNLGPLYEAPCLFWRLSFFTAPFALYNEFFSHQTQIKNIEPASQRALRQEQRAATSAAERGEYLDVVSVRLRNDTFQLLFGNVAVQSAVLVGIAECDIYMRELSEIELAERLIVPIGKVPDYPVRSFALSC